MCMTKQYSCIIAYIPKTRKRKMGMISKIVVDNCKNRINNVRFQFQYLLHIFNSNNVGKKNWSSCKSVVNK